MIFINKKTAAIAAICGWLIAEVLLGVVFAGNFFFWAGASLALIGFGEVVFRALVRLRTSGGYQNIRKLKFSEMYLEPHPYLTFVHKRNFRCQKASPARYPLNQGDGLVFPELTSNNFRHMDGELGNRQIQIPKPAGQVRILCLGASTTGNYLQQGETIYSYPLELERRLKGLFPKKDLVVHNCGQGGWTSADILINFVLNLRETKPDMVVIYHGYNDLPCSLTPGFKSDYSHCRRNLGDNYWKFKLASHIPAFPLATYNFLIQTFFPYLNPRHGAIEAVTKGTQDINNEFVGVESYQRNIETIVELCKLDGISVVLSTYAYFLYDAVKHSPVHNRYQEGVELENEAMRSLAKKHGVPLVDNAVLIPAHSDFFVDSIHFTPKGMTKLAHNMTTSLAALLSESGSTGAKVPNRNLLGSTLRPTVTKGADSRTSL